MSHRVLNILTGEWPKVTQIESRVAEGTAEWVEFRVSFRNLSLAETMELRTKRLERASEWNSPYRIAANELPGLKWEPPAHDKYTSRQRFPLLRAAAEFMRQAEQLA